MDWRVKMKIITLTPEQKAEAIELQSALNASVKVAQTAQASLRKFLASITKETSGRIMLSEDGNNIVVG